jgi:hypothetical protein
MSGVRAFRREDVPQVAALRQRSFAQTAHPTAASSEAYFNEIFFESPWHDPELPSLVYENAAGRIVGFLGRITRRMTLAGEPLRASVATQLCVEREGPQIAAPSLLMRLFAGPQDLTWSDAATDRVRLLWCRLGGEVAQLQSLQWAIAIRPSRVALAGVAGGLSTRAMRLASRLMLRDADSAVAKRALDQSRSLSSESPLQLSLLATERAKHSADALTSADGAEQLNWLIGQAQKKFPTAPLRGAIIRAPDGSTAGWYLFFGLPTGVAEVFQLAGKPGALAGVIGHLVRDASESGMELLRGRVEPELLEAFGDVRGRLSREAPWAIFHSSRREVRDAMHSGRTRISRLDGEWWLNF